MQMRLHVVTNVQSKKSACGRCKTLPTWCRSVRVILQEFFPAARLIAAVRVFVVLCFPSIISIRILSPCRENSDCLYLLIFVASWTRRPIDVSSPLLIISNSFSYLFFYADNKRSSCSRGRFVLGNGWSQGGFPVCFLFSYLVVLICDYRFAVFTVVECKWISFQMYLPMHRHHRRRCV